MKVLSLFWVLLSSLPGIAAASEKADAADLYLGQAPPGDTPAVFAPGIISREGRFEQFLLVSPDESYLVFASNREGSLGDRDLYVSFRKGGEWTEPQSLGPSINSEGYDNYPFVSPDGKSFSSREGRRGSPRRTPISTGSAHGSSTA